MFHRIARNYSLPGRLVVRSSGDVSLGLAGRHSAAAQMCIGTACLLPTTSETEFKAMTMPGGLSHFGVFPEV